MNPRTGNETKTDRNPQIGMKPTLEGIREWREIETKMKPTPEGIRVGNETKDKNVAGMNPRIGNEIETVKETNTGMNPRTVKRNSR